MHDTVCFTYQNSESKVIIPRYWSSEHATVGSIDLYEFRFISVQPSLGAGNVGQLSVDILLASMQPKMVAAIQHPSLLPAVGSDPLVIDSDRLMTACEG